MPKNNNTKRKEADVLNLSISPTNEGDQISMNRFKTCACQKNNNTKRKEANVLNLVTSTSNKGDQISMNRFKTCMPEKQQ